MTRDALFERYQAAIVSTWDPASGWTDPALACARRGQDAVVITAWNPGFERPGARVNRERNVALHAHLCESGRAVWRADGSDPEGTFTEEGFLVWGMPVEVACRLAAEFGQFAIFAYDRTGARSVVPC
jgi:hypothetical protein